MKYLLIPLFCIASVVNISAQTVHFYSGAKIPDYDSMSFRMFEQDSTSLYAIRYDKKDYFLDIYEKELLKNEAHIKVPLPPKDSIQYSFENLFVFKDNFSVFYSYFDEKNLCKKLEMLNFKRNGEKIGAAKLIDTSGGKNARKAGSFSILNSKAAKELLSYGYKTVKDSTYININHFDYTGTKTRTQNISLGKDPGYEVYSAFDDKWDLYRLTRSRLRNKNVKWNVIVYSPSSNTPQIIELKQLSKDTISLSGRGMSYVDDHDQINLLLPYTTPSSDKNAVGAYIVQIDTKSYKLVKEVAIPFKTGSSGDSDNADNDDFSLSSCIPMQIITTANNGLRIVFESRLRTTTTYYGIKLQNEFDIGDIITVDVDSNYVAKQINRIKKKQHTNEEKFQFTGYAPLTYKGKSYFLYNELPRNLQCPPDEMKKVNSSKTDETVVIYATIDSGKVQRTILINKPPKSATDAIFPGSVFRDKNKRQVIYLLRKKEADMYLTKIFIE